MEEIDITLYDQWNFNFTTLNEEILNKESKFCSYCKVYLSKSYSYIIDCLKEAGLLDKDYELICCYCKVLKNFGLLDLQDNLSGFTYNTVDDILVIEFAFFRKNKNNLDLRESVDFNVHNYSKVKWD